MNIYSTDRDEIFNAVRFAQKAMKIRAKAGRAVQMFYLISYDLHCQLEGVWSITKVCDIIHRFNLLNNVARKQP